MDQPSRLNSALGRGARLEISKDFRFEAAHYFGHKPEGHAFRRIHGHSFEGCVTLAGMAGDDTGWVRDLVEIGGILDRLVSAELDHRMLNEIEGLENPSLENLCAWIFARLEGALPGLCAVEVRRPSCGERAKLSL
jgi:6-pyruvoyltetrahydropterin/6-carboxytetrahydropterin synthase